MCCYIIFDFPLGLFYLGHVMSLTYTIINNDFSIRAISAGELFRFEFHCFLFNYLCY